VGLHTCTAVGRSLCVSWAFLSTLLKQVWGLADPASYGCSRSVDQVLYISDHLPSTFLFTARAMVTCKYNIFTNVLFYIYFVVVLALPSFAHNTSQFTNDVVSVLVVCCCCLCDACIADPPLPHQTGVLIPSPNTRVANCGQTAADNDMVTVDSL